MEELVLKFFGSYCLFLVIFGTIFNLLSFYICTRRKLRCITTFVFLAAMFLNDTVCLYIWGLDHFIEAFFSSRIEERNIWICRFSNFVQYVTFEWSSWLLVFLTLDRFISIHVKTWRSLYFKVNQALFCSLVIGTLLLVANSHLLILSGEKINGQIICYISIKYDDWMKFWNKVKFVLFE